MKRRSQVDQTALKVNQTLVISTAILAFVLNSWELVAFLAAVMLLGTANESLALFKQIYLKVLTRNGWLRPNVIVDNPEPHRFAQGFGGVVVLAALIALLTGAATLGWVLVWLVAGLAALNLFAGFCAGCFLYYQLNRLGVRGFDRAPI